MRERQFWKSESYDDDLEMLVDIALEKWREKLWSQEKVTRNPLKDSFRQEGQEAMTGKSILIYKVLEGINYWS